MDNLILITLEGVSAAIAFVLVWFMIKPYQYTGNSEYLGLPLGFASLGVSYVFMGASLFFSNISTIEDIKWLQLFTGSYAFAFLTITYYFSGKTVRRKISVLMQIILSALVLGLAVSCLIVFVPPMLELPSYKTVDDYFRILNMILALGVVLHTLREHALKPEPKTILAPLAYALLAFSQYSFLIWSIDSSFSAFVGAHLMRLTGLLTFLFMSYRAFIAPHTAKSEDSG